MTKVVLQLQVAWTDLVWNIAHTDLGVGGILVI